MHLGVSKAEFLAMSPKEFHALTKCYQEREERMDRRFATMLEVYAKSNGLELTTEDFMGRKTSPTDDQLELQLTSIFGCGPKVKQNG